MDEYQDTNAVQYELIKLLTGTRAMFTAVGDDDQAIYAWRGATLDNLKLFPKGIQRAIRAGVRSIEHGQLADEDSVRMMRGEGVW